MYLLSKLLEDNTIDKTRVEYHSIDLFLIYKKKMFLKNHCF